MLPPDLLLLLGSCALHFAHRRGVQGSLNLNEWTDREGNPRTTIKILVRSGTLHAIHARDALHALHALHIHFMQSLHFVLLRFIRFIYFKRLIYLKHFINSTCLMPFIQSIHSIHCIKREGGGVYSLSCMAVFA